MYEDIQKQQNNILYKKQSSTDFAMHINSNIVLKFRFLSA